MIFTVDSFHFNITLFLRSRLMPITEMDGRLCVECSTAILNKWLFFLNREKIQTLAWTCNKNTNVGLQSNTYQYSLKNENLLSWDKLHLSKCSVKMCRLQLPQFPNSETLLGTLLQQVQLYHVSILIFSRFIRFKSNMPACNYGNWNSAHVEYYGEAAYSL